MSQTQEQQEQAVGAPGERVAQFRAEIAAMKLRDPRAARDRTWAAAGALLMVVGVVIAVVGYLSSSSASSAFNTEGPAQQRDAIVLALVGVGVTVLGAALFLRYSLAQFLRFWLARLIYEQQAQTDRIVGSGR
ncbi:MAG: hypothetical protein KatS3mg010_1209 [Acidimicrobiia bacterium]|nr:MAG: hypothetical protein KatS3mg010_1209 [Acidimicrobiia bacterium]